MRKHMPLKQISATDRERKNKFLKQIDSAWT